VGPAALTGARNSHKSWKKKSRLGNAVYKSYERIWGQKYAENYLVGQLRIRSGHICAHVA